MNEEPVQIQIPPGFFCWRVGGIPILFHWSFPLIGLGISYFVAKAFASTSFELAIPAFLCTAAALATLVLAHELGHALAAKAFSLNVVAIVIHNVGGMCLLATMPSPRADLVVSASGIFAQIVIFVATVALLSALGAPESLPLKCAVIVFTGGNVLIAFLNLLPYGGRDGARMVRATRALFRQLNQR